MAGPACTYGEATFGTLIATLFACVIGCGPSDGGGVSYGYGSASSASSSGVWSGSSGGSSSGNPPVVVLVDPDRTLTAQPGQGVGVFTEYSSGGLWHVWWTCDSNVNGTGDPCYFEVDASSSGVLAPATVPTSTSFYQPNTGEIRATTTTLAGIDQIYFDATPGQPIQLEVRLNGVRDGRFFFFVQNGLVNGGYTGTLSDPLVFSPSP
jgi:hypothetical protein